MNKAKKNYKNKCKRRNIDFYLHEQDLYNFSKTINFQAYVKLWLKWEMLKRKMWKTNDHKSDEFVINLNEKDYRKDK